MKRTRQVARLTADEAAKARALTERHGARRAAKMLGLCDERTLVKAIAQLEVSPLTVSVLRSSLSARTI